MKLLNRVVLSLLIFGCFGCQKEEDDSFYHVEKTIEVNGVSLLFETTSNYTVKLIHDNSYLDLEFPDSTIVIPSEVEIDKKSYIVDEIGNIALRQCKQLKHIQVPQSVTSIGSCAFRDCESLTHIVLPNYVDNFQSDMFDGCVSLESVVLPANLTDIPTGTFTNCKKLKNVNIPDGVIAIQDDAFYLCSALTSIDIPSNVTSIGIGAFLGCSSLTSIKIPSSVTEIGDMAFSQCKDLDVVIDNSEDSVTIGPNAFKETKSVTWLKN